MLFNGPIHSFDYPNGFFSEAVEELNRLNRLLDIFLVGRSIILIIQIEKKWLEILEASIYLKAAAEPSSCGRY